MNMKSMLISSLVALGLLLAACGSGSDSSASAGGHGGHSSAPTGHGGDDHGDHSSVSADSGGDHGGHATAPAGSGGGHSDRGGGEHDDGDHRDHGGDSGDKGRHSGHGSDRHDAEGSFKASVAFVSGAATAGESVELSVHITDGTGKPVNDFEVNHEKLLHLIVVNRDLSFFAHIHPEFEGNGTFVIDTSFPAGGDYKVFADFVPEGGPAAALGEWVKVEGEEGAHEPVKADSELVKTVDGKEVALRFSSRNAGEETTLTFTIADERTGQGIDDLEPYLGAVGHVVILSADAEQYIHVHPIDEASTGPEAQFAASFPKSGTYKLWGQFQHRGDVFTVPFAIDIR